MRRRRKKEISYPVSYALRLVPCALRLSLIITNNLLKLQQHYIPDRPKIFETFNRGSYLEKAASGGNRAKTGRPGF